MPSSFQTVFYIFSPASQGLLIILGSLLLYRDYKINKEKSVLSLPLTKWVLLFTLYLCILTIFLGTTFNTFNNAFYIIHSSLFFLVVLIGFKKADWIEVVAKILLLLVLILSAISIITTIIFIITHSSFIDLISNSELKSLLITVAPRKRRLFGIIGNSNTYAYLLVYTFFIYIFLIIYYKKSKLKYFLILVLINNFLHIVLTGSRGALVSVVLSGDRKSVV